jgi:fibronectin type 3 domain-containing protein
LKRASVLPVAVVAIVFSGMVGVIIVMVKADQKTRSVYLRWNPAPPGTGAPVAGYNIYRRTQSGGPYEKIASVVSSPNYTDRAVESGRSYYYEVRTVDAGGRESLPSNEVSATIP